MNNEIAAVPCSWTAADECAMARERSVAGISDDIPACEVHGPYPSEATLLARALGVPVTELLE